MENGFGNSSPAFNSTQVLTTPFQNDTVSTAGGHTHEDRFFVVWISTFILVVAILVITLNLLVTFTFWRQSSHMESKNVCYVSIAISDLFSGLYLLINTFAYLRTPMEFSYTLCLSLHTLGMILYYVSPYHILMLTIFQFIEIQFPFRPKSMCRKSFYVKLCCGLWITLTLVFVVPLVWFSEEKDIKECSLLSVFGNYHKRLNLKTFLFYVIFLVLQTFFSLLLLQKIRSVLCRASVYESRENSSAENHRNEHMDSNQSLPSTMTDGANSKISKRTHDRLISSAKTLFIYLFAYMICTLPIMSMVFLDMILKYDFFHSRKITISLGTIAMINSIINPMLYFRRFHVLCC